MSKEESGFKKGGDSSVGVYFVSEPGPGTLLFQLENLKLVPEIRGREMVENQEM